MGSLAAQPPTSPAAADPTTTSSAAEVDTPAGDAAGDVPGDTEAAAEAGDSKSDVVLPLVTLAVGIGIVLGAIIVLKVNAFIALITAAIAVSLLAPTPWESKISQVAKAFGSTAGGIGIVIALAAVIGKCMLDSGAADRIVRAFVNLMGEKRAPLALMGSGYVLAVPVFFDTVFYLLVPLARSLHRRTGKQYLMYILAIGAGGALTHSLVPPTPGPLLMASTLNVDLGLMIMIGALVALPAAFAGVLFASVADRIMKTPMRPLSGDPEPEPLKDEELPSLVISLTPVLLPVLMISVNTVLTTIADLNSKAPIVAADVQDWSRLQTALASSEGVGAHLRSKLATEQQAALLGGTLDEPQQTAVLDDLNRLITGRGKVYDDAAFLGTPLSATAKDLLGADQTRMRQAVRERMNRQLIVDAVGADVVAPQDWLTSQRKAANWSDLFGNPNLALLLSTLIAMWTLAKQRGMGRAELAGVVETALMSGGVIILITAGGGAFGGMLQEAKIGDAIQTLFETDSGDVSGKGTVFYLSLGFAIAAVLKIAQGSGTVSMIVGASMMAAIVDPTQLGCNMVYLATAIGAGSLMGSWMNDSGFWIFAKMGGLTEAEALKSWTLMLAFLGVISFGVTLLLAKFLPLMPAVS
ncbi:MAG: gluconate permease [Planctomycetales bacterium]|nr:gluconate permease [Planctomycetales bacterium]